MWQKKGELRAFFQALTAQIRKLDLQIRVLALLDSVIFIVFVLKK